MFAALEAVDPSRLPPRDAITYLGVLERFMCWLHAEQSKALVAAAEASTQVTTRLSERRGFQIDITDAIREEVGAALRLAPGTAQIRIDRARSLAGKLARTGQALASAEISYAQASAIADVADRLSGARSVDPEVRATFDQACLALEDRVLPVARRGTAGQVRAAAERALLALDAEAVKERRKKDRSAADVQVFNDPGGMSTLSARLTTEMAHACLASINTCASSPTLGAPAGANIGARRAFALTRLITGLTPPVEPCACSPAGLLPAGQEPTADSQAAAPGADAGWVGRPGLGVHLNVTISAASLLGISDEPAEITRAGSTVPVPVPACAIRELAALDGIDRLTWRRLVVDPMTGHLLDRGRDAYRVGKRMREWITARDRTCRFPGCERRAARCEVDHVRPWDVGGKTVRGNLGALCKRHHLMKTHVGWSIEVSGEDGSCLWVSPMGRRYPHEPVSLVPELLPHAPPESPWLDG